MNNQNNAACGFVIRDHQGYPLLAMAKNPGNIEILLAEACALYSIWDLLTMRNLSNIKAFLRPTSSFEGFIDANLQLSLS